MRIARNYLKSLRQFLFIVMALTLVLTSCTLEKRVYRTGYQIEWKNKASTTDQQESTNNITKKQKEKNHNFTDRQALSPTSSLDSNTVLTDENIIASIGIKNIFILQKEKSNSFITDIPKVTEKTKQLNQYKSDTKKETKRILPTLNKSEIKGWTKAGFICSLAGLIISLFVGILLLLGLTGILFGCILAIILLGILGVVFSSIALRKLDKDDKKNKNFTIAGLVIGIIDLVLIVPLVYGVLKMIAKY